MHSQKRASKELKKLNLRRNKPVVAVAYAAVGCFSPNSAWVGVALPPLLAPLLVTQLRLQSAVTTNPSRPSYPSSARCMRTPRLSTAPQILIATLVVEVQASSLIRVVPQGFMFQVCMPTFYPRATVAYAHHLTSVSMHRIWVNPCQ